ncbi:MAG: hypothetical protein JWQ09_4780 [Segetibacter sp.]|nr:hypothetical protein [Segetibacter sp.]
MTKILMLKFLKLLLFIYDEPQETRLERNPDKDRYDQAIKLLLFEGDMLWKIVTAFMVVHTLFVGIIVQWLMKYKSSEELHLSIPCCVAGVMGLIMIIPWYGTFVRNTAYYNFRMKQAKFSEEYLNGLLKDEGERFAAGKYVTISDEEIRIPWAGRMMNNKVSIIWLIWIFIIIYLLIITGYGIIPYYFPTFLKSNFLCS